MNRPYRFACLSVCLLGLASCGAEGTAAHEFMFSPASTPVEKDKLMTELSTDERATLCQELSRSLTASFGPQEVGCRFGSHSGTRENQPACNQWYEDCLSRNEAAQMVSGCNSNMERMWLCPITAGQYVSCFNDVNTMLMDLVVNTPVCASPTTTRNTPTPASCKVAPCDYSWLD